MERIRHQPGRKPKFTDPIRNDLRQWLSQQPDLTLMELQERLRAQVQLQVSVPWLWVGLRKIGLRLKKSHSTRKSGTRKPTGSGGKPCWSNSARSRRKS